MTYRALVLFVVAVAFGSMVGCKPKEAVMAPMGEAAPAFGSGDKSTLQTFMVGRWCYVGPGGPQPGRYYEFKSDGTFVCGGNKGEWKSTGKWTVNGAGANLEYQTMKGKSLQDYQAEYKKDEEGGGQVSIARAVFYDGLYAELGQMGGLWMDEDKKHLSFAAPEPPGQAPAPGSDMAAMSEMLKKFTPKLERMAPKKE